MDIPNNEGFLMNEPELIKALDAYFNQDKKFIDVSRIPLICQDIRGIHKSLEDINQKLDNKYITTDNFWPVKTLVYGAVGLMLTGILTALIYLVIK